jgi:ketosteroid isomerase-like protein
MTRPFVAALVLAAALSAGGTTLAAGAAQQAGPADAATSTSPQFEAAARTVDAFHAALARGDTAAAAALLVDDALVFEHGRAERSRAEYAGHHLPGDAAYAQATRHETTRRSGRVAGDLAYVVSEGRTTGRFRDKDVDQVSVETMVLTRVGDDWKIMHVHWSSRASK